MTPTASGPELTVAMPAYNAAPFIREAMESVLSQEGVDLELIVVDDASTDETAAIVASFGDPRVRLLRNASRRGIAAGHNRIVQASRAPYIAHVDADDVVTRPDACRLLLDCIRGSPDLGQVHCYAFRIDERGAAIRDEFLALVRSQRRFHAAGLDYRCALLRVGSVMNPLRLYRKEALLEAGPFDESIPFGVDFDMALRILERYEIRAVPEVCYAVRKHGSNTTRFRFQSIRFWRRRWLTVRRLTRTGQITYTRMPRYRPWKLMGMSLLSESGLIPGIRSLRLALYRIRVRARGRVSRALGRAYRGTSSALRWWPLPAVPAAFAPPQERRLGYYLWRFPVPSQTFVRREIKALEDGGIPVAIFADEPEPMDRPDALAIRLRKATAYLADLDPAARAKYRRRFLCRRTLRTLSLVLYTCGHRHGYGTSFAEDREVLEQAISLAGLLRDRGVTHLHAPWADRCAFVAMIASRLAGIPYSVQARAHDLHRKRSRYGLKERLDAASFVLTNSEYNRDHIVGILGASRAERVHRVYEGIRPAAFSVPRGERKPGPFRVLTVARLVEEKGLDHLLHAADRLRERGMDLQVEIVGGPERPTYAAYAVELRALHRRLGLGPVVSFAGALPFDQVMDRLATADVFVLPCVVARNGGRDIMPNALLEAMAAGLAVVSTTLAAIPEIVTDGEDGVLVPPEDAEALADAIQGLLEDPERRRALGMRARETVEARFDLDRNAREMARLFASA